MLSEHEVVLSTIFQPVSKQLKQVNNNLANLADRAGLNTDEKLVAHAVLSSGKKIRPALTLLSAQIQCEPAEKVVTMATAVELLHIASLIHDDTIDYADTRRGKSTVSSQWGGKVAVLLGDYLFASSAMHVCETGDIGVIRRFSETIMDLARGELQEHFSAFNWAQTIEEYEARIYDKTATLFSTAAESGAILSGASVPQVAALKSYGYHLGMAFQIMDDVLDFTGSESELGKPVGNDLTQGTITLPTLLYIANNSKNPDILAAKNGNKEKSLLLKIVDHIRSSKALNDSIYACGSHINAAKKSIASLPVDSSHQSLDSLTDYVLAQSININFNSLR